MLVLGGLATDRMAGRLQIERALDSGAAAERFGRMVAALGGAADIVERPFLHLQAAPVVRPVMIDSHGFVSAIDTRAVGLAVVTLGGGRRRASDQVDPRVGFSDLAPLGASSADRPIGMVHAADEAAAEIAAEALRRAYQIGDMAPEPRPVVVEIFAEKAPA